MTFDKQTLTDKELLHLYELLITPRLIEEKMLNLLRQNRISKWFSGIGQEAISVGVTAALHPDELIFTLHRNLGVFTTRQMPLTRLIGQWQGKASGFTKGRDRSFHFGSLEYGIVGMISHLGPQLALADGAALAAKLNNENKIAVAFSGEGGTSEGDFHEALNVAAVWNLPVIFVVENNGYGLSTPTSEQFRCAHIADKAIGYGMKGLTIDGNNLLEVYNTVRALAADMRQNPHPVLLECQTFRMRGHEEASGTKYVPKELLDAWEKKDPITNYEQYLLSQNILTDSHQSDLRNAIKTNIQEAVETVFAEPDILSSPEQELNDVYYPYTQTPAPPAPDAPLENKRFIEAVTDGLRQAMIKNPNLVLMGQDIADYGGVFKVTQGFVEEFGHARVRNTPLCESAIVGTALGLSLKGYKAMVEMQFADFVTCGFNQIVNNLAKLHYRWGANADVVVRMPAGGGTAAGPFHSQSNEAWFAHTPGLKVLYPSSVYDAKGLLTAAFEDPNPILYFEHKFLYRSIQAAIPTGYYTVPIGKAALAAQGEQLSIITYGMGVHWATKAIQQANINADILDLRTLLPLDYEAIQQTVRKTGRVIVLHEDTLVGGIGGEIAAYISEHLFEYLDAPVMREAGLDMPIPFSPQLEDIYMPPTRFAQKLQQLLAY
jgi:2-oxoisovalerate dehydrogenase E1 component